MEEVGHGTIVLEVEFVDVARMDLCGDGTVPQRGGNGRRQEIGRASCRERV